jgi:hypothetical protein
MNRLFRLPIVLSVIWFILAFSSFYILDFSNTKNIADSFYSKCVEQQAFYPNDTMLVSQCKKDRDKILNEWAETRLITPFVFAIMSLGIFWIIGFVFMKNSKWAQNGS